MLIGSSTRTRYDSENGVYAVSACRVPEEVAHESTGLARYSKEECAEPANSGGTALKCALMLFASGRFNIVI